MKTNNLLKKAFGDVKSIERSFSILRTLIGVGIALVIAFILISSVSDEPFEALSTFIFSPLSSWGRASRIIEKSIPLLFTGTAVCIMFSAGQINLAVEGTFYLSGIACAAIATQVGIPFGLHPLLSILIGGLCGAIICVIPALMNVKFNAMTVVSSLMINFICLYIGTYLLHYIMRDPAAGFDASYPYAKSAILPSFIAKTDIHVGLFIAIAVVILGYLLLYKSAWGINVRMTGKNPSCCKFLGINVPATIISSCAIGGFIVGIGGAVEQLGLYSRFSYTGLPGYGWDGVMIAVLAARNPKYVPFAVLFLSYLNVGAETVNQQNEIPVEIISIVQATIIMFVAAERFLQMYKHRAIVKAAEAAKAAEAMAAEKIEA